MLFAGKKSFPTNGEDGFSFLFLLYAFLCESTVKQRNFFLAQGGFIKVAHYLPLLF